MMPHNMSDEAVVGISIQPLDAVLAQVATLPGATVPESVALVRPNRFDDPSILARGIAQNLFNFLSSFESVGDGVLVRLMDLERWYDKLVKRLKNDGVGFLERAE
jgi:hypothetical protein